MVESTVYLKVTVTSTEPVSGEGMADDIATELRWRYAAIEAEAINGPDRTIVPVSTHPARRS